MKSICLSLFAGIGLCIALSSCAGNPTNSASNSDPDNVGRVDNKISSQQAYDRGVAAGRYAASLKPDSPEREKALIEIHGMVSSLRRNGFSRSANVFQKGVDYALGSVSKSK